MEISQKIGELVVIAAGTGLTRRAGDDINRDRAPAPSFFDQEVRKVRALVMPMDIIGACFSRRPSGEVTSEFRHVHPQSGLR